MSSRVTDVRVVNLGAMFDRFDDPWHPRIVGEVNDSHVKVVKLHGEFVWHSHTDEDELFLVVSGRLRMQLRDRELEIGPGEFVVVPRGVDHRPVADDLVEVVLIEPRSTVNTGTAGGERTVENPEWLE